MTDGDARAFKIKRDQFSRLLEHAVAVGFLDPVPVTRGRRSYIRYYMTDKFKPYKSANKYDKKDDPCEYLKRWFKKITFNTPRAEIRNISRFAIPKIGNTVQARRIAAAIIERKTVKGVSWANKEKSKIIFTHVEKEIKS